MENTIISHYSIIILAAGQGKRMMDKSNAKVMANLAGKPLIRHVLNQVDLLDSEKTVVVIGYQKQKVIDYIKSYRNDILFVEQHEQLGTGHAVDQAENIFKNYDGNILILCGDVPNLRASSLNKFIDKHNSNFADASVLSTITSNPFGYGRIIRNKLGDFIKIVEEKDANPQEKRVNEINSGVYLVKSNLLFNSLKSISNNNAQGEYYLTDIIDILRNQNNKVMAFNVAEFDELQGVNSPKDLIRAEKYHNKINSLH